MISVVNSNIKFLATDKPDFFQWCDLGLFTIFAYDQRKRYLEALDDGSTKYTCESPVTGIGTWFAKVFFGQFMSNGMKAKADALKKSPNLKNKII